MESDLSKPPWSVPARIAFRFFFIYFILYALPFPLGWVMLQDSVGAVYEKFWLGPVNLVGQYIFNTELVAVQSTGSGDKLFDYLLVFVYGLIACAGTVIWTIVDRRTHYRKLLSGITIYLRYYLGVIMMLYGFAKVIKTQFPFPHMDRLLSTYGDSSPMGLLWTFMGYSTAYNVFTGLAEIIGGLLLLFRKTRMLGCLITIGVMSNVAMLNFTYDVPVKLFSLHLLAIAFFLLLPDARRLINFFVLNRPAAPEVIEPVYSQKTKVPYFAAKALFISAVFLMNIFYGIQRATEYGDWAEKHFLYGVYEVETFSLKGEAILASSSDNRRWHRIIIDRNARSFIEYKDGARIMASVEADSVQRTINFASLNKSNPSSFQYSEDGNKIILTGNIYGDDASLVLVRKRPEDMLLVNRGFHWINEYPYNR
jgi:hypothetical protein